MLICRSLCCRTLSSNHDNTWWHQVEPTLVPASQSPEMTTCHPRNLSTVIATYVKLLNAFAITSTFYEIFILRNYRLWTRLSKLRQHTMSSQSRVSLLFCAMPRIPCTCLARRRRGSANPGWLLHFRHDSGLPSLTYVITMSFQCSQPGFGHRRLIGLDVQICV